MITKTFICDLCKKSVGETELNALNISMKMHRAPIGYTSTVNANRDVCRDCLEQKGILIYVPEGQGYSETATKNQKTLESKLIDLLEGLGVIFEQ